MPTGKEFNKNWYSKRKDLLGKNAKSYGNGLLLPTYDSSVKSIVGPFTYKEISVNLPEQTLAEQELNRVLTNLNNLNKEELSLDNGVHGQYNSWKHNYYINKEDSPLQKALTGIHESNHGAYLKVQEEMISDYLKNHKDTYLRSGTTSNLYLDDPSEILSRRQEFVKEWNVNPETKFELKDVKNLNFWPDASKEEYIKNFTSPKSISNKDFIFRYSPEFIQFLLNDVASKDVVNSDMIEKAQHGNKILNKWQQLYDSKVGEAIRKAWPTIREAVFGSQEVTDLGLPKYQGNIGALGFLVAPEWEGLEFPEITAMHYGNTGKPIMQAIETERLINVPKQVTKVRSVTKVKEPYSSAMKSAFKERTGYNFDGIPEVMKQRELKSWQDYVVRLRKRHK